jgi:ribonucleoside-diphosphate reductase alpha chain
MKALPTPELRTPEPVASPRQAFLNQQDAPPCHTCGAIMFRSGACYKCNNCGATSGCS